MSRYVGALLASLALILGASSSALGDSTDELSLACDASSTITVSIDATALTDLTGEVQALNPAGLSCVLPTDSLDSDASTTVAVTDPPTCTPTAIVQDGHVLTALLVNPLAAATTGTTIDAAYACDIAVYYDSLAAEANITDATIEHAIYYGVVDNNASTPVYISSSSIHDIGDPSFNGSQHGVGIFYTGNNANGSVDGNSVYHYQKNGMAMKDGADVSVTGNTVTGRGPTKIIAQNGIEFLHATSPDLRGNTISMNIYTQTTSCTPGCVGSTTGVTATGFLLFDTNFRNPGEVAPYNHAYRNQVNYYVVND